MIQGFYSAASSLATASQQQDVVSHNLAHATVPGYRQRGVAFSTYAPTLDDFDNSAGQGYGTQVSKEYTIFAPGDYQQTDNPLEVAIRGDGFFVLQSERGDVYTRNGAFQLNAQGQLQSRSGLTVSGTGGPITVPIGTSSISIGVDGTVSANGTGIGQLRIVRFDDVTLLRRVGPTLFEAAGGAAPVPANKAEVAQGFRESGNVNVVQEMVNLIVGTRHYEAASRALKTLSDSLQMRTQPQQG